VEGVKPAPKAAKRGKKSKTPDRRPAKLRYWQGKHLEKNKVKHIMRSSGLTRTEAVDVWVKARGGRRMR